MSRIYKSNQMIESDKKVIPNALANETPIDFIEEEPSESKEEIERRFQEQKELAENIVNEAREEAANLLERERRKIEEWWKERREEDSRLVEDAKQAGYQDGYQEGAKTAEEDLRNQYEAIFVEANQLLQDAYQIKEEIIQESEDVVIDLSMEIAEKIVRKELDTDKATVISMVKSILKDMKEFEKISIFVGSEHFVLLQNARDELLKETNSQVELMIYTDHSITDGGCVIKTSYGTFDGKIDTQLEEIRKILYDVSGRRQE